MAKSRKYFVSFSPAERVGGGVITIKISQTIGANKYEVEASSLPELETKVRELAREIRQTCSPYVRVPLGERKPAGFDSWCNSMKVIDFMPDEQTAA